MWATQPNRRSLRDDKQRNRQRQKQLQLQLQLQLQGKSNCNGESNCKCNFEFGFFSWRLRRTEFCCPCSRTALLTTRPFRRQTNRVRSRLVAVHSSVMAWRQLPYQGGAGDLCWIDDDLGDGLALLLGQEYYFFEKIFWIFTLDESYDERGVGLGKEVADCDTGALALMRVFPELPVVGGDIEGRQDLPMVLLDSRS